MKKLYFIILVASLAGNYYQHNSRINERNAAMVAEMNHQNGCGAGDVVANAFNSVSSWLE